MRSFASIEESNLSSLINSISEYAGITNRVINDVLHSSVAAEYAIDEINKLIPHSGRSWKGKKAPASSVNPWKTDTSELLTLAIKSRKGYNYLYFPDDGRNTENHWGNQQFTIRGANASLPKIAQLCAAQITDEMNHLIK